ncbi:hypothetical protein KKI34_05975 [Pseudoalteromonas tetraodonis]|uniref:hypothetical protein n=1 Tax=Pseudoalteromonas tetraodonis TaxID=43659 RepID=UPI001BDEA882|nr:hypothetical protein [Pseudoalteromonas tetraodonis]MBT2151377.1 hypothetical protein [Pseudoalteromonas tetraodonis]
MVRTLVAASILLLAGCASQRPDLSLEEWKLREYKNHNKEEVIAAAREVIRLSDPSDVNFENTRDGFNATRTSLGYYVVANEIDAYAFNFVAQEKDGVTRTRLEIEETEINQSLLTLGLPVGKNGKPDHPYVYDLFYARMAYLLGDKDEWHRCDDAVSRVSARYGLPNDARKLGMASICGKFSDDNIPNSASKKVDLF